MHGVILLHIVCTEVDLYFYCDFDTEFGSGVSGVF